MDEDFEMLRGERRSFFCPNKLWKELQKKTNDCISISTFIRQAIIEKMTKEEPEKKGYFEGLLVYESLSPFSKTIFGKLENNLEK